MINAGHIAPGDIDKRDIRDVKPSDLDGYSQCHFFAGIGVWSHALRAAAVPDTANIWTGSCPCQPFSSAGAGGGFADERHLWPHFHYLISQCRPARVFGEQVASKDGLGWLDLVQTDLENEDYAFGAVDTCVAGFGAPHIRQRLYWTAHTARVGRRQVGTDLGGSIGGSGSERRPAGSPSGSGVVQLADSNDGGRGIVRIEGPPSAAHGIFGELADCQKQRHSWIHGESRVGAPIKLERPSATGKLADDDNYGLDTVSVAEFHNTTHHVESCGGPLRPASPTDGLWRDADWLLCRDGKWRPVEPGTFPLAHGTSGRVGQLRAYGNAIVAPQAVAFIEACIPCVDADVATVPLLTLPPLPY